MEMAIGQAREHREAVSFAQMKRVLLPRQKVSDGTMAAEYGLRFPSGAGGESDVRWVVGSYDRYWFGIGENRQGIKNLPLRLRNVHPGAQIQTIQTTQ